MWHDGKTGYVPVAIGSPHRSVFSLAQNLRSKGISRIILSPFFPGVPEKGWTTRSLSPSEQMDLSIEITIEEIRTQ
jgi:hypothetical protein